MTDYISVCSIPSCIKPVWFETEVLLSGRSTTEGACVRTWTQSDQPSQAYGHLSSLSVIPLYSFAVPT
eukprot:4152502-Amphidinium_carterae.1